MDLSYPFDSGFLLNNRRAIKRELLAVVPEQPGAERLRKKIAVLGGSTTAEVVCILELFLLWYGIEPIFYESAYAQYWTDAMFGGELRDFKPDVVYIHTTSRNIPAWPPIRGGREDADALLAAQRSHFTSMWDKLAQDLSCPIIQNNFERPGFRLLGNRDVSDFRGRTNYVTRLNAMIYDYAQNNEGFYVNDIDYLSSVFGSARWFDPVIWHTYKYALCREAIPELAFSIANIIKSIYGKNKKALVLDLDETLWGGVVGDIGAENLTLGSETPLGQVYSEFQAYIKAHKDIGVVLSVCSKNELANALAGLEHPDSLLSPDDFAVIKSDWERKDRNTAQIAIDLNIGADSLVFVDDNPAERAIVAEHLHRAAVPDIGEPENYIRALDRSGFFEVTVLSAEDLNRAQMYMENSERERLSRSFGDYADYLASLEMSAEIQDFIPVYYQRIAQLTNKSNQFNLTTKRYTDGEIAALAQSPGHVRLYGRLTDRFGDNGVVSVIIGRIDGETLHIELWLMSCRVLGRDLEFAMLDRLAEVSGAAGITELAGYYCPTAKNGMVREFYGRMGFRKTSEDDSGNTVWTYPVAEHESRNKAIAVKCDGN